MRSGTESHWGGVEEGTEISYGRYVALVLCWRETIYSRWTDTFSLKKGVGEGTEIWAVRGTTAILEGGTLFGVWTDS